MNKVNVGDIDKPSVTATYTGPCGDTMEVYLDIKHDVVTDAKFQAIGCAGVFSSGSALMEMIKDKTVKEVEHISEQNIVNFLDHIPHQKIHCTCLANRTLQTAIKTYQQQRGESE